MRLRQLPKSDPKGESGLHFGKYQPVWIVNFGRAARAILPEFKIQALKLRKFVIGGKVKIRVGLSDMVTACSLQRRTP
jgi:hypothetical protein